MDKVLYQCKVYDTVRKYANCIVPDHWSIWDMGLSEETNEAICNDLSRLLKEPVTSDQTFEEIIQKLYDKGIN